MPKQDGIKHNQLHLTSFYKDRTWVALQLPFFYEFALHTQCYKRRSKENKGVRTPNRNYNELLEKSFTMSEMSIQSLKESIERGKFNYLNN